MDHINSGWQFKKPRSWFPYLHFYGAQHHTASSQSLPHDPGHLVYLPKIFQKESFSPFPSPFWQILGYPSFMEDPTFQNLHSQNHYRAHNFPTGMHWATMNKLLTHPLLVDLNFWKKSQLWHFPFSLPSASSHANLLHLRNCSIPLSLSDMLYY